jgi:uncharacterized protein involved in exopolysaccharide biosynthesis
MRNENLPVPTNNESELHVAAELNPLAELRTSLDSEEQAAPSGMNVRDVFFMLLRHKWKIILSGLAGFGVAAGIYFSAPPLYESQGKLLVRYVVDRSAVDGLDGQIKTPTAEDHALINSEAEILSSSDLIRQTVGAIGIEKLAAAVGVKPTLENATAYISHNLEVTVVKDTNIISVRFTSSDPDLPTLVVQELIKRYFDKHLEVHRSTGAFDAVSKEAAELKKELAATTDELKKQRDSLGIISLAEAKSTLATEVGKIQQELDLAEADLAAQKARVQDLLKLVNLSTDNEKTPAQPVSADVVQRYQSLVARLTELQRAATELLSKFTPQNPLVRTKTAQIEGLEKQRNELEKQYPGLLDSVPATTENGGAARPNVMSEKAILVGMESKVQTLKTRMSNLEVRMKTISDAAPQIEELERKAELEETNYKHSEASLEKAQVDETLDPSRMPNISVVQTPPPATKAGRNLAKTVLGIAGGGFGLGVGLAFLIELILDTTVKRPLELEKRLRLPLMITIPYLSASSKQLRLRNKNDNSELVEYGNEEQGFATGPTGALVRPFCEAIRDRLGVFFEVNNMAYKPKLVAVTGLSTNAGASTIAAGLADAFSEFSAGKVVLIDKVVSSKGFHNQLMEFKRSDLDYVVFDMPCLGDTSSTLPLAGFMDTVLLVIEAEKSNRDAVKRAYAQLAARTNVSVVFNKRRSYGPKWLEGDL